jgi:aryl-alcohol dehydrogenase-like predicted oxidoreductase
MTPQSTFSADDWRSRSPDFSGDTFRRNLEVVDKLKGLAQARAISLPQLAMAWTLAHPGVDAAIVGARRPSHLEGTASAAEVELSEEELRETDRILADAVPVWGPHPEGM